jgi:hypothetical protein
MASGRWGQIINVRSTPLAFCCRNVEGFGRLRASGLAACGKTWASTVRFKPASLPPTGQIEQPSSAAPRHAATEARMDLCP